MVGSCRPRRFHDNARPRSHVQADRKILPNEDLLFNNGELNLPYMTDCKSLVKGCRLFINSELNPPVQAAVKPGIIGGYRTGAAITTRSEPACCNPPVDKIVDNGLGTGL